MTRTLRCPYCPDSFQDLEQYDHHYHRIHETDFVSGAHHPYLPPLTKPKSTRPTSKPEQPDQLFGELDLYD